MLRKSLSVCLLWALVLLVAAGSGRGAGCRPVRAAADAPRLPQRGPGDAAGVQQQDWQHLSNEQAAAVLRRLLQDEPAAAEPGEQQPPELLPHQPPEQQGADAAQAGEVAWSSFVQRPAPHHASQHRHPAPHAHHHAHHHVPRRDHAAPAPAYRFMLSRQQRHRAVSRYGGAERLRAALTRAVANKRLTVAVVGGSISAGTGAEDAPPWVDRLERYLRETYQEGAGINVTVNNGAVPGTTSAYAAACANLHAPADADIVFVEYSVNDDSSVEPPFDNPVRRPYERLLRKLLSLPGSPAVVLLHAYAWFKADPQQGAFYSNAERELDEFAQYYDLPTLSVKGCCHEAMRQGLPGFQVHSARDQGRPEHKGSVFYWDWIHPDGNTGHRVMAELAITLLQRGAADLLRAPLSEAEAAALAEPLPPPMVPGNWQSVAARCFVGDSFRAEAVQGAPRAWEWVNESRSARPKWGYVATAPGAELRLAVNSTATSGQAGQAVLVQLAYLRSYQHMGKALVRCVSGCTCEPTLLNGHHEPQTSLLMLHGTYVSQAERCELAVTVAEESDSPGAEHKVKLAAVIVSEEAGQAGQGLDNSAAVEHVHDISFRHTGFGSGGHVFDIRNHVR